MIFHTTDTDIETPADNLSGLVWTPSKSRHSQPLLVVHGPPISTRWSRKWPIFHPKESVKEIFSRLNFGKFYITDISSVKVSFQVLRLKENPHLHGLK